MPKILVVDRDPQFRAEVAAALTGAGQQCISAQTTLSAHRGIREERPDCVILDLQPPFGDALEAILEIRRLLPSVRILAVSNGGHPDRGRRLRMAEYVGADASLAKPVALPVLLAKVAELLSTA